jgi:hypothetical protein
VLKEHDFAGFDLQKLGPTAQIEKEIRSFYDPVRIPFSVLEKPDIREGDAIPVYFFENREIHRINRLMSDAGRRRRRFY